jgi:hypothetical protein
MSGPLEKFIRENREEFNTDIPGPRIWENIRERMNPKEKKEIPLRSLPFKRWMTAAAAVVVMGVSVILYYSMQETKSDIRVGRTNNLPTDSSIHQRAINVGIDSSSAIAKKGDIIPQKTEPENQLPTDSDLGENKEMYYYAKLIELKHEELKTLEKDEPLLYRQFAGDVKKLDSVYHSLKTKLPDNSNREQVIEAMISNLQLQIGLLNRQLEIIKQIKHSKKSAYENAYKSA